MGLRSMCVHFKQKKGEKGFGLAMVLLLTIGFAFIVTFVSQSQKAAQSRKKSESIAWQITQISKAARLYVRNNALTQFMEDTLDANGLPGTDGIPETLRNSAYMDAFPALSDRNSDGIVDNFFKKTELDPGNLGPAVITITDLINAGYLPQSFNRVDDGSGANISDQTILGHALRIYAANSPINGNPALDTTVATAYIVMEPSTKATPSDVAAISIALQAAEIPISVPLFSAGANISDNCGGGPAVGIWDTGCLDDDGFDLLTGNAIGTGSFAAGAMVIPAWKAAQHDERAVMRFPQPENSSWATMLTDMRMGAAVNPACTDASPDAEKVLITQDDGLGGLTTVFSGICKSVSDNSVTTQDNRRDIYNVVNFTAERIIAADQRDRTAIPNAYRDMRIVLDGSAGGITTTGESYIIDDNRNLEPGSDVTDTRDFDDVVAIAGTLSVTGDTKVFNDANYAYTNNGLRKVVFTSGVTIEDGVRVANDTVTDATAQVGTITGTKAEVATDTLTATAAELHVGIEAGKDGLSADAAKSSEQAQLNLNTLTIQQGRVNVDPTLLDAGSNDFVGLTTNLVEANGADFVARTANFAGSVKTRSLQVADQGSGLYQPIAGTDPNVSTIFGSLTNSGNSAINTGNISVDDFATITGDTHYIGTTNITKANGADPDAICTGGFGECPSLEDAPGTPF